jgi:ADP-ribose pyrophosphatase
MNVERPKSRQSFPENAKKVFSGHIFDVYQWEVIDYDGKPRIFEKLKRADTSVVIPVTEDGKIIMANQEQPNKGKYLGCLGGRVDEGETPFEAAKRELLEESGYESNQWDLLFSTQPVAKIEWAVYLFIAKNCKKVAEQNLDGGEKIDLIYLSFEEFVDLVLSDEFYDIELKFEVIKYKLNGTLEEFKKKLLN